MEIGHPTGASRGICPTSQGVASMPLSREDIAGDSPNNAPIEIADEAPGAEMSTRPPPAISPSPRNGDQIEDRNNRFKPTGAEWDFRFRDGRGVGAGIRSNSTGRSIRRAITWIRKSTPCCETIPARAYRRYTDWCSVFPDSLPAIARDCKSIDGQGSTPPPAVRIAPDAANDRSASPDC